MKTSKIFVLVFLCLILKSYGQDIKPMTIGDTVPDITFDHLLNYKAKSVKLSDFKGKPVIIDFFATWCTSCIAALPHLDSLQKRFGDSIQIFVVSYEPKTKLESFIKTNKKAQNIKLIFIAEDTLLKALFPHKLIPHEIIIKDRSVKAITYPEYITEETMQTLFSGMPIQLPIKKDLLNYNNDKSLQENGNIKNEIIYHSLLTSYLEGFGSRGRLIKINNKKRLTVVNAPIISLYLRATDTYQQYEYRNRLVLEVSDSSKYIIPSKVSDQNEWNVWALKHCFSYELTVPDSTSDRNLKEIMRQDLNRYLGINGRIENRKIKCLKLVFNSPADTLKVKSKGGKPVVKLSNLDTTKFITNEPLSVLLTAVNRQTYPNSLHPVVIDGTGYTQNIDLSLKIKDIQDLQSLSNVLAQYGLKLTPAEVYMDVLVISEK